MALKSNRFSLATVPPAHWWWLAALATFAAASLWLLNLLENQDSPGSLSSAEQNNLPDYTVEDFTATHMDLRGRPRYQLQSLHMLHYPVADSELTEPYLVFYIEGEPVWYVRAREGRVSSDGQTLRLLGETRVWRYGPEGERQLYILSSDVLIKPEEEYAETAAPTRIVTRAGMTESVGARLYLPSRRVELLSQVKGHYEHIP